MIFSVGQLEEAMKEEDVTPANYGCSTIFQLLSYPGIGLSIVVDKSHNNWANYQVIKNLDKKIWQKLIERTIQLYWAMEDRTVVFSLFY